MAIVEQTLTNLGKALEKVNGYESRCKVIYIVIADIFNANNIKPKSKEAFEVFDGIEEDGFGLFQHEADEIYRLMELRK